MVGLNLFSYFCGRKKMIFNEKDETVNTYFE